MKTRFVYFLLILIFIGFIKQIAGQAVQDSATVDKKVKIKKGLSFGALPVIGYNSDIGLQYGLIFNLYNYGDGTMYPEYKYSLYTEFSRTTKGSGVNQIFFDSKRLIPGNIRITADLSYLTELALNFYGFNGYDAFYNPDFEDDQNKNYISRMFYRHERKFTRFTTDFQGRLASENLKWFAGIGYFDLKTGSVDVDKLNKGKNDEDLLPDTALLYDKYVDWGLIKENEKNGGTIPSIKVGLIYDTRDHEPNPMKGIWSEALLFYSSSILGNTDYSYLKLAVTHRQYFTLIKNDLSFAYRLGYQGTLAGDVPFYMQPYMINSFAMVTTTDGLGGAKTLRGILRNRIVGDDIAFGNFEFRWKFFRTVFLNQNIYLALNAFSDVGRVLQSVETNTNIDEIALHSNIFAPSIEELHWSAGGGFRIVLNHNFVVAVDYGRTFDKRDGTDGFYAGIGYLF